MWGLDLLAGAALGLAGGSRGKTLFLALLGGVLVAAGGGIARDLIFGLPLYVLAHPAFVPVAAISAWGSYRLKLPFLPTLLLDLAGTLYFAWGGAERGLAHGLSPEKAALAGTITAIGGGVLFTVITLFYRRENDPACAHRLEYRGISGKTLEEEATPP